MQAISKVRILWGAVVAFGLLSGGCANGPRYEYIKQGDSARIEAPIKPVQHAAQYGSCYVEITQIDGLGANFVASRPGVNWIPGGSDPLYLAPGKHAVTLDIGQIDEVLGETGRGHTGIAGAFAAGSRPTLTREFAAKHVYRFTASLSGDGSAIDVTLWDESGGFSKRSRVASWRVDSNRGYSENIPPVHSR